MKNITVNSKAILNEDNTLLLEIKGMQDIKNLERKPMNVSIVIDCSGSMSSPIHNDFNQGSYNGLQRQGLNQDPNLIDSLPVSVEQYQNKLQRVIQAAKASVNNMSDEDYVSIVSFSNAITTHLELTNAKLKQKIFNALDSIVCSGMTNLYEGWRQGAITLAQNLDPEKMNRVLLFTDGQTNQGETSPDIICSKVNELAQQNISTSTFGIGADYNEDLLENMAISGDGHFYFISDNESFDKVFEREFNDMSNTVLNNVKLELELNADIKLCLNGLNKEGDAYILPNLLVNQKLKIAFELKNKKQTKELLSSKINVIVKGKNDGKELVFENKVNMLKNKKDKKYANEIINKIKLAMEKRKAVAALDGNDVFQYKDILSQASINFCSGSNMISEKQQLDALIENVDNNRVYTRKANVAQSYNTFYGRNE